MVPSGPPQFGTVYAVLLNHRDAVAAVGDAAHAAPYDKPPVAPVLYLRPANTWSATGATVVLPDDVDAVDVEATVGIVFARATSHVAAADALDHVRGVVVVGDLTAASDPSQTPLTPKPHPTPIRRPASDRAAVALKNIGA